MNVIDLVTDTLRRSGIIAEAETPSAEQGADAVTRLNDMMAEWAGCEIDFGWNPKATTAETADLPLEHVGAIKACLGVRLCGAYGVPIDPVMAIEADTGYSRILRQATLGLIRPVRTGLFGSGNTRVVDIING